MNFGFESELDTRSGDGLNVVLLADAFYSSKDGRRFCLPAGATSDGASTPREIWPIFPPFGKYWRAAVLHDCGYRRTLKVWNGSAWVTCQSLGYTRKQIDDLLLEAMDSLGVDFATRETIYEAVRLAGQAAFDEDSKR